MRERKSPIHIIKTNIKNGRPTTIAGPMVRYSKLPFRATVRQFNCDIIYTPMVLAREFVRNETARLADFTTNDEDSPVILQVGVSNVEDMVRMVTMVEPFVDGVGINCGCPIKDQVREGIGAALMNDGQRVYELVKVSKQTFPDLCIDVKIRIHQDLEVTKRFIETVEPSGVDFFTVHGRTKDTRSSQPVDLDAIKFVKSIATIPVIANGDCFTPESMTLIVLYTGVDGVMAARGVLQNPAIFAGYCVTPWCAIEWFWHYAIDYGLHFRLLQHHLSKMMGNRISNKVLREMNLLSCMVDLIDWFDEKFDLKRFGEDGFGQRVDVPFKKGLCLSNGVVIFDDNV